MKLLAYIVDDETLAIERLTRLLDNTGRVEIVGSATSPSKAIRFLETHNVDVLFLDISMPGMTGFDLLGNLTSPPNVVFTTAYDQHALKAFEVNSLDYLLKPIEQAQLDRALNRVERLHARGSANIRFDKLFESLAAVLRRTGTDYPERIASRLGDRVCFIDLTRVSHFYAEEKLTYAVVDGKTYCIDQTITALEALLNPKHFIRIHRATLLNSGWVREVSTFGGSLVVRLKDAQHTELTVARNRISDVKRHLGL
jgi:two-component system LytT family response regulator